MRKEVATACGAYSDGCSAQGLPVTDKGEDDDDGLSTGAIVGIVIACVVVVAVVVVLIVLGVKGKLTCCKKKEVANA